MKSNENSPPAVTFPIQEIQMFQHGCAGGFLFLGDE